MTASRGISCVCVCRSSPPNLFASVQVHGLGARLALDIAAPVELAVASLLDRNLLGVVA